MYIGQVAALTGVSNKALRHYEALGLLPSVRRRGTYRIYTETDVTMIRMIKHAQSLGFQLNELLPLMQEVHRRNPSAVRTSHHLINEKSTALQKKIDSLSEQLSDLKRLKSKLDELMGSSFGLKAG